MKGEYSLPLRKSDESFSPGSSSDSRSLARIFMPGTLRGCSDDELTIEIDGGSHRFRRGYYLPVGRKEGESVSGGNGKDLEGTFPPQGTTPSRGSTRDPRGATRGDLRDLGRGRLRGCESSRSC